MRTSFALAIASVVVGGCEGSQPPIGTPGAMPPSAVLSRGHRSAAARALVYISDLLLNQVKAYNYSDGGRVLTLTGFTNPSGVCSDTNGNVFVLGQPQ